MMWRRLVVLLVLVRLRRRLPRLVVLMLVVLCWMILRVVVQWRGADIEGG